MRIVVKVGTSTLAHPTGRLNIQRMEKLCKVLSDLKNMGHEIILVSSGAIAMGFGKLNLSERPKDVPTKQASAAVGQCELMYIYDKLFTEYNHTVAQLLITAPDIEEGGVRKQNFHNTLARLLELGALPVINENDTISTEEFGIGDNDTLSAIVAVTIQADLLILLSDIDGLFDGDPRKNPDAKLIDTVEKIDYAKDRCNLITFGSHESDTVSCRHGDQAPRRADGDGSRLRNGHRQRPVARGTLRCGRGQARGHKIFGKEG